MLRARSSETTVNDFYALRDVSFQIEPGEVVGIIGRNGAGKSTLLKVLSQIVEPTSGRVEYQGRMGSLLEVGTGFHPELTGRENIYLNGSILGMTRKEIDAKFDEIVQFAELTQFLDTPVKRYSSGMYVRLAFAIASHLEPEILILDEVLAVGDAQFQKKCLGKMRDVSSHGRTVLFVSHDMTAVRKLCKRCIMLGKGSVVAEGDTDTVVSKYLEAEGSLTPAGQELAIDSYARMGNQEAKFVKLAYYGASPEQNVTSGGPMTARMTIHAEQPRVADSMSVILFDRGGYKLLNADTMVLDRPIELKAGENVFEIRIRSVPLNPGIYTLGLWLCKRPSRIYDYLEAVCEMEIVPAPDDNRMAPPVDGVIRCDFELVV
ncbi:ABC transporter ATP-binding protein [Telmatocola sphagniphila]